MTALYSVLALGFLIIILKGLPGAYRDTVKHRRLVKEAEAYREMLAMMPALVVAFQEVTISMRGVNEAMARFVDDFRTAWEKAKAERG